MTQEQIEEILEGQRQINGKIDRLLSLFNLESTNEDTNPILDKKGAAELLGVAESTIALACTRDEIPCRRLGSKYIFSKMSLLLWLHHINEIYLDEKHRDFHRLKFYENSLERWIRLSISPKSGAKEEYGIKYDSIPEEEERLNAEETAELLQLSVNKVHLLSRDFLFYKFPIEKIGTKYQYSKEELLKWMETRTYKKVKEQYDMEVKLNEERLAASRARQELERLAEEAKKKRRNRKK